MSSGLEKPKYVKVSNLVEANKLVEEGYSLRCPIVYTYHSSTTGRIETDVEYLMSLREDGKYDNVEKFRKVPITAEEQGVPDGWEIIHHTSKEMILVKRREEAKT